MGGYLLAASAGVLAWLAFPGVGIWPLAFVAYVPFFLALDRARRRGWASVVLHALTFGLVWWTGGYYWMLPTLERFAGFSLPFSLALAVGFWMLQAGHAVLFGVLWCALRRRGWAPTPSAAAAFGAIELSYPQMFPSYYGASLQDLLPLMQLAELGGPILLSVLCIAVNGALYEAFLLPRATGRRPLTAPFVVAGLGTVSLLYGAVRMEQVQDRVREATTLRLGLIQANLPATLERDTNSSRLASHIARSEDLLRRGPVDLLVWPENACGDRLRAPVVTVRPPFKRRLQAPVLFGTAVLDDTGRTRRTYNAALLAGVDGRVLGRYDKNRLVAFSERSPVERLDLDMSLAPSLGSWITPGVAHDPLRLGNIPISVLICYEDILPGYVRRVVARASPQCLINLTNDAWFGQTTQPRIHAALARFRAIEHRTCLVRATTTGVSVVYGPDGCVLAQLPPGQVAVRAVDVPLLTATATPYARHGDVIGWLSIAAAAGMLLARRRATSLASP